MAVWLEAPQCLSGHIHGLQLRAAQLEFLEAAPVNFEGDYADQVRSYLAHLRDSGLSPEVVQQCLGHAVVRVWTWAEHELQLPTSSAGAFARPDIVPPCHRTVQQN